MKHNKFNHMFSEGRVGYNPEEDQKSTKKLSAGNGFDLENSTIAMSSEEIEEIKKRAVEFEKPKDELLQKDQRIPLNITIYEKENKRFYKNVDFDIGNKIGKGGQTEGVYEAKRPEKDLSNPEIPREIAVKVLDLAGSIYSPDHPEKSYKIASAINEFMITRLLSSGSKNPNVVTGKSIDPMEKGSVSEYFGVTPIRKPKSKEIAGYAFAMRKIEGTDLKKELEKRRYIREKFEAEHSSEPTTPLERGIYLREALKEIVEMAKIAKELADRNIAYNDFKPQNIMIDKRGKVCLVDFGIAELVNPNYTPRKRRSENIVRSKVNMLKKMAANLPEITSMDKSIINDFIEKFESEISVEQSKSADESLEKPDLFTIRRMYIPGTLEYLAPEKIENENVKNPNLKSDIFSLGIIFLEYLYGEGIFNNDNLPKGDLIDIAEELARRKNNLEYVDIKSIDRQATVSENGRNFILPLEDELINILMSAIHPEIKDRPEATELFQKLSEISDELGKEAHLLIKDAVKTKTDKIKSRA